MGFIIFNKQMFYSDWYITHYLNYIGKGRFETPSIKQDSAVAIFLRISNFFSKDNTFVIKNARITLNF